MNHNDNNLFMEDIGSETELFCIPDYYYRRTPLLYVFVHRQLSAVQPGVFRVYVLQMVKKGLLGLGDITSSGDLFE